jgi:hypothetical protein
MAAAKRGQDGIIGSEGDYHEFLRRQRFQLQEVKHGDERKRAVLEAYRDKIRQRISSLTSQHNEALHQLSWARLRLT